MFGLPAISFFLIPIIFGAVADAGTASWQVVKVNSGVPGMHMQLLHTDRVIILDRTYVLTSNISLPPEKCRDLINCYAHSVEYDVVSSSVRPLRVVTDPWCSSGAVLSDGTLVHTGGNNDGYRNVRVYNPSAGSSAEWEEKGSILTENRWYSTNQILPDGRVIIVGGLTSMNYEFYPKKSAGEKAVPLPFLSETNDPGVENNLYPFVALNTDGNLFIFANNRAILLDYVRNVVVKTYPVIPGGEPRSYPSSGSGVLLPLSENFGPEVLICGGAPKGSFAASMRGIFIPALSTCARIRINDPNPAWEIETLPTPRVMSDMILLPNGDVLIINGFQDGTAGWEQGTNPAFAPVLYHPDKPVGNRFEVQPATIIPRMYHSTAVLLRDGRVLIAGSNPHNGNVFTGVPFPTELRIEAFSPDYMKSTKPPVITSPASQTIIRYQKHIPVQFTVPPSGAERVDSDVISVTLVSPAFSTHALSMNQRVLVLKHADLSPVGDNNRYEVMVRTPVSENVAPAGYYMMFVVFDNVPSEGIWVQLG